MSLWLFLGFACSYPSANGTPQAVDICHAKTYERPGRYIESMGEKDTFSSSPRSRRLA